MPAMWNSKSGPASDEGQASVEEAREAITNYSRIIQRRLRPSLEASSALRDKAFFEIAELKQMSKALNIIKLTQKARKMKDDMADVDESGSPKPAMETRVNIGEEFYVRANIYNLEQVIVDVGLGVMIEMTPNEATRFVDERLCELEQQAEKHSMRISEIQAHLQSITECLAELKIATASTKLWNSLSGKVEE